MTYLALGFMVVVYVGALAWLQRSHVRALSRVTASLEAAQTPEIPAHDHAEIRQLQEEFGVLRMAVAEGIEHVERVERRIQATVRRARKELAEEGVEHPGLEAEASELQLIDGGGSDRAWVPPVPENVGGAESSIPGVTQEQIRRVRGV